MALRYAADAALLKRNGAEPGTAEIEIIGEDLPPGEPVRIRLTTEQPLTVKAEAVLREKLGVSRSAFDRMLSDGRLVCVSGQDLKKAKLSGKTVIELYGVPVGGDATSSQEYRN